MRKTRVQVVQKIKVANGAIYWLMSVNRSSESTELFYCT